jgi:nitrite reductase/ring-hydroxylating ferredoxin subunit
MPWIQVAQLPEIPIGALKQILVNNEELVLGRVGEKVFATQGYCGHMNMHLHLGKLEGNVLQCPYHSAKFNVESGEVVSPHSPNIDSQLKRMGLEPVPTRALKTYQVKVDGERVSVLL